MALCIYKLLEDCRDFGLKDQIQRSAVSIASNIAERGGKDFTELRTQVYIAKKVRIIKQEDFKPLISELTQTSKMIHGLRLSMITEN